MFEWYNKLLLNTVLKWQFIVLLKSYTGCVKRFYCIIYTIKLCNKTIHNVKSKKKSLFRNNILYQRYNIFFLMTYLLLDTINFARSGICLSEVCHVFTLYLVLSRFPVGGVLYFTFIPLPFAWWCQHDVTSIAKWRGQVSSWLLVIWHSLIAKSLLVIW